MRRISHWLYRLSTGWVPLAAAVVFALFTALVLPAQATQAVGEGQDTGSPDLSLFYTPTGLYRMAEAYGPQGRRAYVRARFTFDVAWPLVYAFFLGTTISWLLGRALDPRSPWRLANLAPLLAATLDLLENTSTSLVMWRYPARTPMVDLLAPVFTLTKWIAVGGSFAILVGGAVIALWKWRKKP